MIKNFDIVELKQILDTFYGLKVDIIQLGGYIDLNYLLVSPPPSVEKNVLKISSSKENQNLIRIQNYVLNHLKQHKLSQYCFTPQLKITLKGQEMIVFEEKGQKNFFRVFNYIQGRQMWDFNQLPDKVFRQVGQITASLSFLLQSLSQRQIIQSLLKDCDFNSYLMNIMSFTTVYESKKHFLDQDIASLIQKVKLDFQEVKFLVKKMPQQILHNDVCFSNILINQNHNNEPYVSGLIDFSSLIYGPRIIELVIPCARINLSQQNPLKNMFMIIGTFNKVRKLTYQQKLVLYPLIKMRLAFLCLVSCQQRALKKQSDYVRRCKDGHVYFLKVITRACTNKQFLEKLNDL